jgi:hypothetical protein
MSKEQELDLFKMNLLTILAKCAICCREEDIKAIILTPEILSFTNSEMDRRKHDSLRDCIVIMG